MVSFYHFECTMKGWLAGAATSEHIRMPYIESGQWPTEVHIVYHDWQQLSRSFLVPMTYTVHHFGDLAIE